jgi:hypothetical protein
MEIKYGTIAMEKEKGRKSERMTRSRGGEAGNTLWEN